MGDGVNVTGRLERIADLDGICLSEDAYKPVDAFRDLPWPKPSGMHRSLCGEFAFQAKFKRRDELNEKAMERMLAIALANKLARIAWSVLARGQAFEANKLQIA